VSDANRFRVAVDGDDGWSVVILDPDGERVFDRACATESEARAFASTVEQHVSWLSEEQFRRYYRL
jgi:hypothetical protein